MPDHIHTIPVLDALRQPESCPFCVMRRKLDDDALAFIMGPAYMEDDIRMETNRIGFCADHLQKMYDMQNRLGLALMLHTYMQQLNKDLNGMVNGRLTPPRFGNKALAPSTRLRGHLDKQDAGCYLCRRIDATFDRYMETFFMLWGSDKEATALMQAVPRYCLPHFAAMLDAAEGQLSKGKQEDFLSLVIPKQLAAMKELETDLEWFTLKFDYRNVNEPWHNAKDALPRAMAMLGGGVYQKEG